MFRKIFEAVLGVAAVASLASLAVAAAITHGCLVAEKQAALQNGLALAAAGLRSGGAGFLRSLDLRDSRITWIAPDGRVLYDSRADATTMPNHAGHDEVRMAHAAGHGVSVRHSGTLGQKTIYAARRLADGSVLRLAATADSLLPVLRGSLAPMLAVVLAVVVFAAFFARRAARGIVRPINRLNLEQPLENDAYPELAPLLRRIDRQGAQIREHLAELRRRAGEIGLITGSMREGLVLLDPRRRVLSINPAAMAIFDVDGSCLGRDFLHIDRGLALAEGAREAAERGHAQRMLARNGREYRLDISRAGAGEEQAGLVMLISDITEQARAERSRREFSANVSHELKTPLQTIMGSAELMENGLVAEKDIAAFSGRIRREALRLSTLVDDIIHLSELDENASLPESDFSLLDLARACAGELADFAAKRRVSIDVAGDDAQAHGPLQLAREIVRNLCDNAIRYNRPGGWVRVRVRSLPDGALLSVRDGGIGIEPAERERIFERFYRVDKSRSREGGGTGLGLSIVRHAASRLGAVVSVDGAPGQGSVFSVTFSRRG